MSKIRTAMGRMIDMDALVLKNEKIRAVSNMKVNARGDIIDTNGNVVESANDRVAKSYNNTVGNRSARSRPVKPVPGMPKQPSPPIQKIAEEELTPEEIEFQNQVIAEDLEIDKLKSAQTKK